MLYLYTSIGSSLTGTDLISVESTSDIVGLVSMSSSHLISALTSLITGVSLRTSIAVLSAKCTTDSYKQDNTYIHCTQSQIDHYLRLALVLFPSYPNPERVQVGSVVQQHYGIVVSYGILSHF